MAPQTEQTIGLEFDQNIIENKQFESELNWQKIAILSALHLLAIFTALNLIIGNSSLLITTYFQLFTIMGIALGIECGVHRYWSHRSYKANLPLRVLLMIMNTLAFQEDIYKWVRDHRGHHKSCDTNGDPYNSSRGFFFCHIGWYLVKKHPDVINKGKRINMSDVLADPVVRFQQTYYWPLVFIISGVIPIASSMYLFDISLFHAFCENSLRFVISSHLTWTVNSVAHLYGMRPYDKSINPRNNNFVIYSVFGGGYHNYHHVFPYDYSSSQYGCATNWNPATAFIHFFHSIGWATDLKLAPKQLIKSRSERTGDPFAVHFENKFCTHLIVEYITGIISLFMPVCVLLCLRFTYLCAIYVIY